MRYLFFLLLFAACTSAPPKTDQPAESFGIAALAAPVPDSTVITKNGDTIRYYTQTKTGTYTYTVPVFVISYKTGGGTVPPVDTIVPPTNSYQLSFTQVPWSDPGDYKRPGAGAEQWHDRNDVNLGYTPADVYYRFVWTRLEGRTLGSYNWSYFDNLINSAINAKQKFSFGIMTVYPDGTANEGLQSFSQGGLGAYPEYIHNFQQSQAVKDWRTGSTWTPNYNNSFYTDRLLALYQALNQHIAAGSFNGVNYKDVINCIDIRGYGAWGEWHSGYTPNNSVSDYPAGTFPTAATLKKIVDCHTLGFPNYQLVCMIAGFDAQWLNNTWNPPEIAYYLLTQRNSYGLIGWRRDQWGAIDQYLKDYLENNNRSYNGLTFKDSIMPRYKQAPITGEPPAWNPNEYADLERQIRLYGARSFGNGNYGGLGGQSVTRVRASSKAAGDRLSITSGSVATSPGAVNISLHWSNSRGDGQTSPIPPTYDNWAVLYDLVNSSGVTVKTVVSKFKPRLFNGTGSTLDAYTGLPSGTYKLVLRVNEPYRGNKPLNIKEKNTDFSVTLVPSINL